jgi:hypothetical protein
MARISWVVGVCLAISSVSLFFGDKGPHGLFEYAYIAAAVFAASALIVGGFFYLFSREFPSSEPQSGGRSRSEDHHLLCSANAVQQRVRADRGASWPASGRGTAAVAGRSTRSLYVGVREQYV